MSILPCDAAANPAPRARIGLTIMVLLVVFFGYVLSAPLFHDERGLPLRIHKPVWSAAMEGPFSPILRPYFKLCGIDFQRGPPEPTQRIYE